MGVPITGEFEMFGTGSEASIAGAINSHDSVSGVNNFNDLTSNKANINFFDPRYSRNADSLDQIKESIQYRNYPLTIAPSECPSFTVTEVTTPNEVTLTFEIYSVDGVSTGVLNYGSTYNTTLTYNLTIGNSIAITALNLSTGSAFAGWSTFQSADGVFQTGTTLSVTAANNATFYAVIQQNNYIKQTYCYTDSDNLNDICLSCNTTSNVYFNKSLFEAGGAESITWYSDSALTTTVTDGYYYLSDSINKIIYSLSSGTATLYGTCEDGVIYCS